MIKDTTTITTYKFTSVTPQAENAEKISEIKLPLEFNANKKTKKRLNVKKYRVTDILHRVN